MMSRLIISSLLLQYYIACSDIRNTTATPLVNKFTTEVKTNTLFIFKNTKFMIKGCSFKMKKGQPKQTSLGIVQIQYPLTSYPTYTLLG